MELEGIIIAGKNFCYTYTAVTMDIWAGLNVFLAIKPKTAAKALGGAAAFLFLA